MTSGASGHRRGTTRRRPTRRCSNRRSGGVSTLERHAVASFVAGLHGQPAADFYAETLRRLGPPDIVDAIRVETARGVAQGPHGWRYPHGPLSERGRGGAGLSGLRRNRDGFRTQIWRPHSSTRICSFFTPATQARRRCISFSMRDGRRRTSLPCRSLYRSWLSRFASWWACAHFWWPPKAMGPSIPRTRPYSWAFWPRAISEKETSKMAETTLPIRTTGSPSPSPRRSLAGCRGSNRCLQTS